MSQFSRGWKLSKQSFSLLKRNKKLLIYPILSAVACIVLLSLIASPLWHLELSHWQTGQTNISNLLITIGIFVIILWACNFIIIFCNAAFTATLMPYLDQRPIALNQGFRAASRRLPQIYLWSLLSSTFGTSIRLFESWLNNIAFFTALFAGITWTVISYFIVPILVIEKVGPFKAIKRASQLLQKTWGTSLISNLGLGLLFFLPRLFALMPIAVGFYLGGTLNVLIASIISMILLIFLSIISATVHNILQCALYHYAVTGETGSFDSNILQTALRSRLPN